MHVLVTGAGGFVGSAVVARLAGEHRVRALDVVPVAAPPGGEAIAGDLADWAVAQRAVAGVDAVVHLATGGSRPGTTPPSMVTDSAGATVALFEALRAEACRRVVLVSSLAVVTGYPRGTRIGPDTPVRFRGTYPLTKHLQEEVGRHYAWELGAVVPLLRPWVVVDADRRVLRDGTPLDAEPDPLGHDGAWGWIERRDLADACALAITARLTGAPVIGLAPTRIGRILIDPAAADALGWHPRFDFAADLPPDIPVPDPPSPPEARP